jgi:hypothetical protein
MSRQEKVPLMFSGKGLRNRFASDCFVGSLLAMPLVSE